MRTGAYELVTQKRERAQITMGRGDGCGAGKGHGAGSGKGFGAGAGPKQLLPVLAPITKPVVVETHCKGSNMLIDGHGWLHRFCIRHAAEFVGNGNALPVIADFLDWAQMLSDYGILLTFIFDGKANEGKDATTSSRRRARELAAQRVAEGPDGRDAEK